MEKRLEFTVILVFVLAASLAAAGCSAPSSITLSALPLPTFQSAEEFIDAFRNGRSYGWKYLDESSSRGMESTWGVGEEMAAPAAGTENRVNSQYSTTNVQVAGVDEADTVKTDGEFIYTIASNSLCIVAASPPRDMRLISRISFDDDEGPSEMFVNGDRLAVIGSGGIEVQGREGEEPEYYPYRQVTFVKVYDVSDRENPRLLNTMEHEGCYAASRMIDDNVYAVLNNYPAFALYEDEDIRPNDLVPLYRTTSGEDEPGAFEPACDWSEVEYVEPEACSSILSILSFSLADGGSSVEKREIAGNAQCVYASPENLYVAAAGYWGRPFIAGGGMVSSVSTSIYKFRFDGPAVSYLASGEVPGTVLNQFSMDESDGYFRLATTSYDNGEKNNVYVLDPSLAMAGKLEGLAPGETIHSARFMGKRAYLVTFEKVDPFFVIDLADPKQPKVLGELKIPGYSDYLHPYDEDHVIGVGINAVEAYPGEGDFSWFQGMKIALFDVSDVSRPREMHKVEIGDRGTDSYALQDHRAFLFDRGKNLMVLPVLLAELTPEQKAAGETPPFDYGTPTFQGACVYDISLAGGITLRGRITHIDAPWKLADDGYFYYERWKDFVQRSLYIGDSLYTLSQMGIKANDLASLEEQAFVTFQ